MCIFWNQNLLCGIKFWTVYSLSVRNNSLFTREYSLPHGFYSLHKELYSPSQQFKSYLEGRFILVCPQITEYNLKTPIKIEIGGFKLRQLLFFW